MVLNPKLAKEINLQGLANFTNEKINEVYFFINEKIKQIALFNSKMIEMFYQIQKIKKTFGFKELKKGYFPHYFNTPENQNYVGPIPEKEYYSPDQMSPTDREAFLEWYQTKVDGFYTFDFAKELREYCRSDVDILRRSMMQFRANFIEKGNLDPFRYVTIASVCMAIFRSSSMPLKQIAVVKDTKRVENFSEISIK